MKDSSLLTPLFKQIDAMFFGVINLYGVEKEPEFIEIDTEEEFDVERSTN